MKDWNKGYIKVIPQKSNKTKNKWSIQFLSDGIKEKIENGTFSCKPQSLDCPTLIIDNYTTAGITIPTIWDNKDFYTAKGTDQINLLFNSKTAFTYAKPIDLVCEVLGRISGKNDIILDSFSGSGTTAHAVLNLNKTDSGNRKFILIEMMDYADTITAERVKRVIGGYGDGKNAVAGTGGNFSYYELGEPLMIGDELNEDVGIEKIREYVYFTETKSRISAPKEDEPYYLGTHITSAYYFYYDRENVTTLSRNFLHTVKTKADSYVIYADLCTLSDAELEKYHITFKKIPRDITKL